MNLLTAPWVPVRAGTQTARRSIAEIQTVPETALQSPRPDWDFALRLLLVALAHARPPVTATFGNGPRLLQSRDALSGSERPISTLLLGEPGESTMAKNRTLFIRPRTDWRLCQHCATLALYTHSQFSGPGGAGIFAGSHAYAIQYLAASGTVSEFLARNAPPEPVEPETYFSVPALFWLDEPGEIGQCSACEETAPLVQRYWRKRITARPSRIISPHSTQRANGKFYSLYPDQAPWAQVVDGCCAPSGTLSPPAAIAAHVDWGEEILAFGLAYNKAALTEMQTFRFPRGSRIMWKYLYRCVKSVEMARHPKRRAQSEPNKTVWATLNDMLRNGLSEHAAAWACFDQHAPEPFGTDGKYYERWVAARYFLKTGTPRLKSLIPATPQEQL